MAAESPAGARPGMGRSKKSQERRRAVRAALKKKEEEIVEGGMMEGLSPDQATKVIEESFRLASEGLRAMSGPSLSREVTPVTAASAEVTDEIAKGGPAFGEFVKSVGLAVAEAQTKLDENLVKTAEALSKTQIDVIAVFEQQINDADGSMGEGKVHLQKLPLINYILPTAYQWTRVYLQADMRVSEFNGANGFNIQGSSRSFSAGASGGYSMFGGFSARGSVSYGSSSFSTSGGSSFSYDQAVGSMHMEATLEPRPDLQLPRPFVLQKGPRLKLVAGNREDILGIGTPPPVIGRKVTITAELRDSANNPLSGKQLAFQVADPAVNYTATPANGQTTTAGALTIELRREGAAFNPSQAPVPVLIRVWFGLVTQELAVNL